MQAKILEYDVASKDYQLMTIRVRERDRSWDVVNERYGRKYIEIHNRQ